MLWPIPLQDPKIPIQSYNRVLQVNLPFAKLFISNVTTEMGEAMVLHSYFTDIRDILATAVNIT